jgi:hypothetical protein
MRVVFVVLLGAILAGVLWGAAELHHRSCVTAATARTPVSVVTRYRPTQPEAPDLPGIGPTAPSGQVVVGRAARERAVNGCSRWPW